MRVIVWLYKVTLCFLFAITHFLKSHPMHTLSCRGILWCNSSKAHFFYLACGCNGNAVLSSGQDDDIIGLRFNLNLLRYNLYLQYRYIYIFFIFYIYIIQYKYIYNCKNFSLPWAWVGKHIAQTWLSEDISVSMVTGRIRLKANNLTRPWSLLVCIEVEKEQNVDNFNECLKTRSFCRVALMM